MEPLKRKPFQGVLNIIRFNQHFYITALVVIIGLTLLSTLFPTPFQFLAVIGVLMAIYIVVVSLLVSFYIYDVSDLYRLNWLKDLDDSKILNINAGFDETSQIIRHKFPDADLTICDFYNSVEHTEISIKRARKIYPPNPEMVSVTTDQLPFPNVFFDKSLAILSAHEIRKENERIKFFLELNRITKSSGQIMVTEHLRDFPNFLAYTVGFFHFLSRKSWLLTFEQADLIVKEEIRSTPFITTFILEKNGNTL